MRVWPMRVRAGHARKLEAARDVGRTPDLLVDLDRLARAHDAHGGMIGAERRAHCRRLGCRHRQHGVRRAHQNRHLRAGRLRELGGELLEIAFGLSRLDRDLDLALGRAPVDREPGRVRTAVAHRREHTCGQRAELTLEARVLHEKSDDAAHKCLTLPRKMPSTFLNRAAAALNEGEYNIPARKLNARFRSAA